jgi:hypothetical protein
MKKHDKESTNFIRFVKLLDITSTLVFIGIAGVAIALGIGELFLSGFHGGIIAAGFAFIGALSLYVTRRYIRHNRKMLIDKLIKLHDENRLDDDESRELHRILNSLGKPGPAR